MTEWGVVGVIIAVVGLFFTVGKPVITLNTSITKLTVTVDRLQKDYDDLKKQAHSEVNDLAVKNSDSHRRIHESWMIMSSGSQIWNTVFK